MVTIDMQRLRNALPKRASVTLNFTAKRPRSLFIECKVSWPGLYDKGTTEEWEQWQQVLQWQREIIGKEAISEFYTEEQGHHWYIHLNRIPLEFINCTDEDIKSYTGFTVEQLTKK